MTDRRGRPRMPARERWGCAVFFAFLALSFTLSVALSIWIADHQ